MNHQTILNKAQKIAILSALQAGKRLKNMFVTPGRIKFSLKSKHQVVTAADIMAEKIILHQIKKNFPTHDILSEEVGFIDFTSTDYLWIVDPLDGTTNFTMKNPIFSTAIALAYKGEVVLGVIFAPLLNELYVARRSQGAYLNGKKIKVSAVRDLTKGFHTYCYGTKKDVSGGTAVRYYRKMFMQGNEIRQLGAATIECARVAQGITESIVIPGVHAWDVAAGALLIREAGGKVTDFKNQPWTLQSKDIVATNDLVHKKLLHIIHGSK